MSTVPFRAARPFASTRGAPAAFTLALVSALALALPMAAQAAEALRVVKDAKTGELRGPTAAEAAAFERAEAQLRASSGKKPQAPVEIRHPDGTLEMKLGEDTHMVAVVREAGDGTLAQACLPAAQARDFVKGGGAKSTPKRFTNRPAVNGVTSHD